MVNNSKIELLNQATIDKIAAGEVVERQRSTRCVPEAIENRDKKTIKPVLHRYECL